MKQKKSIVLAMLALSTVCLLAMGIASGKARNTTASTLSTVSYIASAFSGIGLAASAILWKVEDD